MQEQMSTEPTETGKRKSIVITKEPLLSYTLLDTWKEIIMLLVLLCSIRLSPYDMFDTQDYACVHVNFYKSNGLL